MRDIVTTVRGGKPMTCKFCHGNVGYNLATKRVVNLDAANSHHSDSCERRKAFYKNEAALRVQGRRDARGGGL